MANLVFGFLLMFIAIGLWERFVTINEIKLSRFNLMFIVGIVFCSMFGSFMVSHQNDNPIIMSEVSVERNGTTIQYETVELENENNRSISLVETDGDTINVVFIIKIKQ